MPNNAYSLWRVNGCQQGFRFVVSFGFGGQESALKPPQAICKTLVAIDMKNFTITFLLFLVTLFTYGQGVDSVVKTKIIKDNKFIIKETVYFRGRVSQELYKDSLGKRIHSIYFNGSGQKRKEHFNDSNTSIEYYKNGNIKQVDSLAANGQWFKTYSRNGKLKHSKSYGSENIYFDSLTSQIKGYESILREYDWNWRLVREEFYKNGIALDHRKRYKYNENGILIMEYFEVEKDAKIGKIIEQDSLYKTYYDNGRLECNCNLKDGKRDGSQKAYYKNGQLGLDRLYKNGKLLDIHIYDTNGSPLDVGTFHDGNGVLNIYSREGKLIEEATYVNGEIVKSHKVKTK